MFYVFLLQTCYELERYLRDEPKLQSYKKMHTDLDTAWDIFSTPARLLEELKIKESLDTISTTSSVSSNCSGISWDSDGSQALSCAVVVKQERIDEDDEDAAHGLGCDDKLGVLLAAPPSAISPNPSISSAGNMTPTSSSNTIIHNNTISSCNSTCNTITLSSSSSAAPAFKVRVVQAKAQRHYHLGQSHVHDLVLPTLTPPSSPESSLRSHNYAQPPQQQQQRTQQIDASDLAVLIRQQQRQHQQQQHQTPTTANSTSATAILHFTSQIPGTKNSTLTQATTLQLQQQQQQLAVQHLSISPQALSKASSCSANSSPSSNGNSNRNSSSACSSSTNGNVDQSSGNHGNIPRSTIVRLTTANGTPGAAGISLARVIQMQNNGNANVAAVLSAAANKSNSTSSPGNAATSFQQQSTTTQQRHTPQVVAVVTSRVEKTSTGVYWAVLN